VSFIGNNVFAYSASCYHFGPEIIGVQRNSDGTLAYLNNFNPPFPAEKSGGFYCPWLAAADPTDHVAIAMQPLTSNWTADGPWQLATYTADASGNLTTSSTYSNMPKVLVGAVNDYWMSPNGKFLAVGGSAGLQIFHFNGANPITHMTGLLTSDYINQMFWDNANHLYAISYSAGKLYVFTVSRTGVTQAVGSPHSIASPGYIIVLPRT
jgi:Rieske Fe-S protein